MEPAPVAYTQLLSTTTLRSLDPTAEVYEGATVTAPSNPFRVIIDSISNFYQIENV